jgi:prepilin-type N-terminal cleavage/methylation domain-containing protein
MIRWDMTMNREQGFTLIEVLVSLLLFCIIVVGAGSIMGAANSSSGLFSTFPVGFAAARVARDYTVASVHAQALHEFFAGQGTAAVSVGAYCSGPDCPTAVWPAGWSMAPVPPIRPYQFDLRRTDVVVESWYWDSVNNRYCLGCAASTDHVVYIKTTLTWQLKDQLRTMTVERAIL